MGDWILLAAAVFLGLLALSGRLSAMVSGLLTWLQGTRKPLVGDSVQTAKGPPPPKAGSPAPAQHAARHARSVVNAKGKAPAAAPAPGYWQRLWDSVWGTGKAPPLGQSPFGAGAGAGAGEGAPSLPGFPADLPVPAL